MHHFPSRTVTRLLAVAALALAAFGITAASSAAGDFYSWPGSVALHVHTTPADASPGYVQSDPYYIDCPNACDRAYDVGQSVTLQAYPTGGFAFTSWTTGPCAGSTANPCTFTITKDTDVTADFSGHYVPSASPGSGGLHVLIDGFIAFGPVAPSKRATVSRSASAALGFPVGFFGSVVSSDGGIACFPGSSDNCTHQYPVGATVSLHADGGFPECSLFLGWEDAPEAGATRSVTLTGNDKTVIAAFLYNPYCFI